MVYWKGGTGSGDTRYTWNVAANWSGSSVPGNLAVVVIPAGNAYKIIATGSTHGYAMTSFKVEKGYGQLIGTAALPLKIKAATVDVGGNQTAYLNLQNAQIRVTDAGNSPGSGQYALHMQGTGNSRLDVSCANSGGAVSYSAVAGDAAGACATVTLESGNLTTGASVAITTLSVSAGTLAARGNVTTATQRSGSYTQESGTVGTLNNYGGTTYYETGGTMTTANVAGVLDFSGDLRPKTVAACNVAKGGTIKDPAKVVTFTNGIDLENCGPKDVTLDIGSHIRITRGSVS